MSVLHPLIAEMFAKIAQSGRPALSAGTPQDARTLVAASRVALGAGPDLYEVRELSIPTRAGSIAARLYMPSATPKGLTVYLHGGGWVVGALDDYDTMARTLASRSGCALLMPDYRLAPEHAFPAGLSDTQDAIEWAASHMQQLIGSAAPFLVAGDSAGANLVAVSLNTSGSTANICGQVLIYPVTDCDFDRPSYKRFSEGMQLTREDMQWFFSHYAPTALYADPRISPLRQPVTQSLPPTAVFTAEVDVLRDEGEAYAMHLKKGGVQVSLHRFDGLPHGFIRLHNLVDAADVALTDIAKVLGGFAAVGSSTHHASANSNHSE